jgi:hypothetical protein
LALHVAAGRHFITGDHMPSGIVEWLENEKAAISD